MYFFRGYAFAEQCISGPRGVHDDLIGKGAFEAPAIPILFRRGFPFVTRGAGIDLAQDRLPPASARKLEDLGGGVAVGKDGVIAVVMIERELGDCLALKPFISL